MPNTPPLRLESREEDVTIHLWNASNPSRKRQANPTVDSIYAHDSDETFVVSLEEKGKDTIPGRASAFRLAKHSQYSDDPLTALAEYAARLLAMVDGQQGIGWTVYNDWSGRQTNVVVESVEVIRRRAEKYEFEYSISLRTGESINPFAPYSPEAVNPQDLAKFDGQTLHEVEEMRISKKEKQETYAYITAGTSFTVEDNEIMSKTGAMREIQVKGTVPGDEATRKAFDDFMRTRLASDTAYPFENAFPGSTWQSHIVNYDASREAGVTQTGSYNAELVEGGGF